MNVTFFKPELSSLIYNVPENPILKEVIFMKLKNNQLKNEGDLMAIFKEYGCTLAPPATGKEVELTPETVVVPTTLLYSESKKDFILNDAPFKGMSAEEAKLVCNQEAFCVVWTPNKVRTLMGWDEESYPDGLVSFALQCMRGEGIEMYSDSIRKYFIEHIE